jgi:SAM-dependent methyltransferase
MLGKLNLYRGQLELARQHTDRFAIDHCMWFERMRSILRPYIPNFQAIRALDLGCGLLQWQTIMLHSLGATATGVDMEYVRADRLPDKYIHILRTNGLERAAKTLFWDYTYRDRYRRALATCSTFPLNLRGLDFRQHTAEHLPFEDNTFDLVASHEVFEHIADVPAAVREVKRVLKPSGIAYINIHLFPSISGGHNVEWKYPDEEASQNVPPWDHLRGNTAAEHPSWINKMRERDYRPIFESELEILCWEPSAYEGRALLTPAIKAELPDYTEEELLKKGVIVVARKKASL